MRDLPRGGTTDNTGWCTAFFGCSPMQRHGLPTIRKARVKLNKTFKADTHTAQSHRQSGLATG
jgi:hypothetical protein